jgi:hypothetical protein
LENWTKAGYDPLGEGERVLLWHGSRSTNVGGGSVVLSWRADVDRNPCRYLEGRVEDRSSASTRYWFVLNVSCSCSRLTIDRRILLARESTSQTWATPLLHLIQETDTTIGDVKICQLLLLTL